MYNLLKFALAALFFLPYCGLKTLSTAISWATVLALSY